MKIIVDLKEKSYPILIEKGALDHIDSIIDTQRKLALIVDDGVPEKYVETIRRQCPDNFMVYFPQV